MRIFRLTILLIVLLAVDVISQTTRVAFDDGTEDWQRKVERLAVRPGITVDSLTVYLTDNGFLDNHVRFSKSDSAGIMQVSFGPRYNLGCIIIEGEQSDSLMVNNVFSAENVNGTIDSIIAQFRNDGHYFTSAVPLGFEKNKNDIELTLQLAKGPVVRISQVELTGLEKTDVGFMRRYIPIRTGDTLKEIAVGGSAEMLEGLDFVTLTGSPEIIPDAGYETARVRYGFIEMKQFYFEGAGGYIPDDDGYYIWYIDLRGRNLFGQGEKAGILADSREKYKSIFRVYYGQPLFLFGPGDFLATVRTRDYRDQFYEFGVSAGYELSLRGGYSLGADLGWKNVEPSSGLLRAFRVYEVGVGVKAGTLREYRGAPLTLVLDWNIKYSGRRYKQAEDTTALQRAVYNDTRTKFRAQAAGTIYGPLAGYLAAKASDIESGEKPLPVSELFLFGGTGTLRGYRNDQFSAFRLILMTAEMRLFFSRNDYLYPFADGAYFENYISDVKGEYKRDDDFRRGYGFGVKLSSGARQLRVEFSWGDDSKFSEPRLGVSLTGQF